METLKPAAATAPVFYSLRIFPKNVPAARSLE
jgi:hypothetical protein